LLGDGRRGDPQRGGDGADAAKFTQLAQDLQLPNVHAQSVVQLHDQLSNL
jgi:hypothetical protein